MKTIRAEDTARILPALTTPEGDLYDGDYTACAVPANTRPTEDDFRPTQLIGDKRGLLVSGLTIGLYDVYAHIDPAPQHLNILCGRINVE